MIPYIVAERNQNVVEVSADFIILHNSSLIMASLVDISGKVKKVFSDTIQDKGMITLRDRSNIFYEESIRTYNDSFKYKLNKHDNKNTHGIIHNTRQEDYVFDWNGDGLVESLTTYMSNKQYLPVTEDIVEKVLAKQTEYYSIVEQCDIYTTQEELSNVGVWYVNSTAFKQSLEQVDMEADESFNWDEIEDISDYLVTFVDPIKEKLNKNIHVLYDEKKIDEKMFEGNKIPYDGQIPQIMGGIQTLMQKGSRFIYLAATPGSGKTFMGTKINHLYHSQKGKNEYVSLVVAPAITLTQWESELKQAIKEDIEVIIIKNTDEFIRFYNQTKMKVNKPTYLLVGKETFKLSYQVEHGVIPVKRKMMTNEKTEYGWDREVEKEIEVCLCPDCGKPLQNKLRKTDTVFFTEKDFSKPKKSNYKCSECDAVLFQAVYNKTKKTSIAEFVKRRNIQFSSIIFDEFHESNNAKSIIGTVSRNIMKQAKKVILLSGTVSNGYASSIYNVLFALKPNTLKKDNVFDLDKFVKTYGTLMGSEKIKDSDLYKSSRIEVKDSSLVEVEGINPLIYTKYFSDSFLFCDLEDIRSDLPELKEYYVDVPMTEEHRKNEKKLMEDIEKANAYSASFYKDSVIKHYTNNPFNWKEIPFIFKEGSEKMDEYVQPVNMQDQLLPKEEKLIEICKAEKEAGRKTWVYTDFVTNGKYTTGENMQARLARILTENGLKVYVLKGTTKPIDRKKLIEKKQKEGVEVFLSHPKLVNVGINMQFCTNYIFYTPTYHVNTVRQAKLRGRRADSTESNKIFHLFSSSPSKNSLEDEIMLRYQLKAMEAEAIESKFDMNSGDAKRTASGLGAKIEESLSKQAM